MGARPHPSCELYRGYLEQSHVFFGVYGKSYGWIAPDMEISGLEDEYLLAEKHPKLIYVKDPVANRDDKLKDFLRRIEQHDRASYKIFSSADVPRGCASAAQPPRPSSPQTWRLLRRSRG